MTYSDDEIALPGNRELIERELSKSVAQVLHLVPGRPASPRCLQEVGVDIVLSVTYLRVGEDIAEEAEDYARAKADVTALLRRGVPEPR